MGAPEEKKAEEEDENAPIENASDSQLNTYRLNAWKKEFRPFYNPQDFSQPMTEPEAKRAERDIFDEVRLGIGNVRTTKNLDVKLKPLV